MLNKQEYNIILAILIH